MVADMADWLAMGGYGEYLWPAYGVAVAVLGGLALHAWRWHRATSNALDRIERRSGRGR
jgi:heme exporter protein CcmD